MGSPSLNVTDSPSKPEHAPADAQVKRYAQLHGIAQLALVDEDDPQKRQQLQDIVTFADRAISEGANAAGSGGAPVPNIQLPPPPPAPPAQGAAPGMPPAAPGAGPGPAAQAPQPGAMPS